jgi:hypothetical protein
MNKEEQAALDVVMKFLDGYSGRNVDDCMSAIAASKSILMVGTNDNEVFRTPEDVRAACQRRRAVEDLCRRGERTVCVRNVRIHLVLTPVRFRGTWQGFSALTAAP